MKVVILCGGRGTRLREETEFIPKPLIEIGGRPILWHIMKIYSRYGFNEFILCLGYKGEKIKEYFLNFNTREHDYTLDTDTGKITYHNNDKREGWKITFVETGLNTNTGGRIKQIQPYIKDDTFLCTYGDGVADIDMNKLIEFHNQKGKLATLTGTRPASKYGVVKVSNHTVFSFVEKPEQKDWVNGGFFVLDKKVFDYIKKDVPFEHEPLTDISKDGELVLYPHDGDWFCMDTYKDYLDLNDLWDKGRATWKCW